MERQPIPQEPSDERSEHVLRMLAAGVESAKSEEGMRAYLTLLANLYDYSPQNCLLIAWQRPQSTMVNSFTRWKQLGRYVKQGERGLKIFYPEKRWVTQTDPETGEAK